MSEKYLAALGVSGILVLLAFSLLATNVTEFRYGVFSDTKEVVDSDDSADITITIVGDVFLGRAVERLMSTYGAGYPYAGVRDTWSRDDIVLINFESAVPPVHRPTPDFGFQFSVAAAALPNLAALGVTHASLANNHSYDFGVTGYRATEAAFTALSTIEAWGSQSASSSSVRYVQSSDETIALVALTTVGVAYEPDVLARVVATAAATADFVLVYIHWGEEYQLVSNVPQQELARLLVDAGASAIVGHHPHVVQEVDWYNGAPIFYSLGNFIFDQYFSTEVQEGLVLSLTFLEGLVEYNLRPVTSVGTRSQPRFMPGYERDTFLEALAERSSDELREDILRGQIPQTR